MTNSAYRLSKSRLVSWVTEVSRRVCIGLIILVPCFPDVGVPEYDATHLDGLRVILCDSSSSPLVRGRVPGIPLLNKQIIGGPLVAKEPA